MTCYRTEITQAELKAILDYDPLTGVFTWRHRADRAKRWNSRYAGTVAGQISGGYVCIQINGHGAYQASRLAWLYMTGEWPPAQMDHINGVRSDNRWVNLRAVDNAKNNQNRAAQRNNIDGARGLSLHQTAGWRVRLMAHGVNHDLGYFLDRDEALAARKALEVKLHGEYAAREGTAHGSYAPRVKKPTLDL